MAAAAMSPPDEIDVDPEPKPTLTPPASEEADKQYDSGSELSELDLEMEDKPGDNNEEIEPDHYYDGGKIPVFKPTMDQFRSFKSFIHKIDKYGMKSGIVKVIPPKEWRDKLPALDEQVKTVKVKNPIIQEFHGTHGTYTQANIEKQRSYNLAQWKSLCEESNHQPPAKRGERRRNQEKVNKTPTTRAKAQPETKSTGPNGKRRGPGRPRVRPLPGTVHKHDDEGEDADDAHQQTPPTPLSPPTKPTRSAKVKKEQLSDDEDTAGSRSKGSQQKSVSSRRQHNRGAQAEVIDEEAFKGFDYRIHNQNEWTPERCHELETAYWKSLNFNNPMYGADMPGSLFDDGTENWNVAKLENLLDVIGQKIPGVNTAYLYLGMWKATFAWHLEDVDLYSINYIHFGAPKQWYSISQEDARRFEAAMRSVWPTDSKACDQFLRHKTYLISPQLLQSQYNIRVNRLVHHEGEFVITFPYGYHSGYNLGYNCAESVNFATESWLDYGRVAKKCHCEADSVWVDVHDIERRLRGEPTPEYYEETEEEDDEDEEDDEGPTDLPTPPGSDKGKPKRGYKRKRDANDKDGKKKVKKLRIKIKAPAYEPCVLCPNDSKYEILLPTDNGKQAHRRCALYTPETYISEANGKEKVCDVAQIDKARLEMKCNHCRSKTGAVFQCSQKKCVRAYHATCAAEAGVQVDIGLVPVYAEDGTEYTDTGIDFRCRYHRIRRNKNVSSESLEESVFIRKHALKLPVGEMVQMQFLQKDIFAGVVVENRRGEQTVVVEVLPKGVRFEIEYKWLLLFDPTNSQLPVPSENAKPLPPELARKSRTTAEDPNDDQPRADQPFCDATSKFVWSEFHTCHRIKNPEQKDIDFTKPKSVWFYLGRKSTEAKAQYTGDLAKLVHDPNSYFLDTVKPPPAAVTLAPQRRSFPASYPTGVNIHALNAARANAQYQQPKVQPKPQLKPQLKPQIPPSSRPYNGKYAITEPLARPRASTGYNVDSQSLYNQRTFTQNAAAQSNQGYQGYGSSTAQMSPSAPTAPMMGSSHQRPQSTSHSQNSQYSQYSRNNIWTQPMPQYQRPPQQIQQTYSQPQTQAPIANMMSGQTPPSKSPFVTSKPVQRSLSVSTASTILSGNAQRPSDPFLEKYPYLREANKLRPAIYQSPYAAGGGFTAAWMPNSKAPLPSISKTLSQDFLMHRSPSQQERVTTHMRRQSETSEQLQRDKIRSQQQQQQIQSVQRPHHQYQQPPSQTYYSMPPAISSTYATSQSYNPQYRQYQTQYSPPMSSNPYSYDLSPRPYTNPYEVIHHSPPQAQQRRASYGLQYQSPQDFQLQMQRESQAGAGGFDHFFKGLQNAAAAGHRRAGSSGQSSGGGQGSPIKSEMGNGGEMLPVMREQY